MRWMAILLTAILGLGLWDSSYSQTSAQKQVSKKSYADKSKNQPKKHYKAKKKAKRVVVKPPRKVNDPREGELLKLEGMIKDLNEQ